RRNRSVSLSSAARLMRNRLTSAETDVARSAALMRARRYVSSSSDTVMFFTITQYPTARTLQSNIATRVARPLTRFKTALTRCGALDQRPPARARRDRRSAWSAGRSEERRVGKEWRG